MPATEAEVEQLLEGALIGDAFRAFGLAYSLTREQLQSECRIYQSLFQQDKGNPITVSQIANACASVICGKDSRLSEGIMKDARVEFQELMKAQRERAKASRTEFKPTYEFNCNDGNAFFTKLRHDRVTSPEMVSRAKGLVNTFEVVPRSQATPHTTVRKVFMRVLNLTSVECGWLMGKAGLRRINNSKILRSQLPARMG